MAITISILALLGAFGGRWLMRRELFPVIANARASSERANRAATIVEEIALGWPGVLERVEELDRVSRKAGLNSTVAKQAAGDAVRRQDELEQSIAGALNISLR
jgi:hypothetical protein